MQRTLKICSACGGGPWPLHRFYKNSKRKDGSYRYTGRCRKCVIKATRENENAKPEYYKQQKAARAKQPKALAVRQAYLQSERGKQVMRESRKAWNICHPEKYQAIQRRWNKRRNQRRKERAPRGNDDGYQDPRNSDAGHCGASHLQDAG